MILVRWKIKFWKIIPSFCKMWPCVMSLPVRFVNTNLMLRWVQCHGNLVIFWVNGLAANKNLQLAKNCSVQILNLLFTLLEGAVGKDRFQSRRSNLRNVWSTDLLHADHLKAPFPPGRASAIMLIPPLHGLLLSCPTPKLRTKGGIALSKWNKGRDYEGLAEGKLAISFFSMIYL